MVSLAQDAYGSPLTFSGGRSDTLMLALLRAAYSGRHDTHLVASMEQALPLQPDWLNFNRFCLRAEGGIPLFKGVRAHLSGKGARGHVSSIACLAGGFVALQQLPRLLAHDSLRIPACLSRWCDSWRPATV
jgi:hypothetical protein